MPLFLDLRATSVGGILAKEVSLYDSTTGLRPGLGEFERRVEGRDVLLVAHGFNVDRQGGINRLSWWESRLQLPTTALLVGILWPGDSAFIPALDYPIEGDEAIGGGRLLAPFVDAHLGEAASVSFASHSLGARVVLEAIRRSHLRIRSLTLMAGAIDDTCLNAEYSDIPPKVGLISILASQKDDVLEYAFPLGNFLGGLLTRGNPYWHAALGREGPQAPRPDNLRGPWRIPDGWDYGHGDYFGTAAPLGPLIAAPVDVPPAGTAAPLSPTDWKPAWSAAFAATRR